MAQRQQFCAGAVRDWMEAIYCPRAAFTWAAALLLSFHIRLFTNNA
jgi:hypothetical protein